MSRNIKKAQIIRFFKAKEGRSLEKRVAVLEKQITDMQAAMICELNMLSARIVTIENINR
ncbi:TPA: hypothetical protein ACS8CD_003109 [Providencia alcalifaciens]